VLLVEVPGDHLQRLVDGRDVEIPEEVPEVWPRPLRRELVPYPIEDEEHLAERRREMHLIDFEEYRELLLETYRPAPAPETGGDGPDG